MQVANLLMGKQMSEISYQGLSWPVREDVTAA